MGLKSLLAKPLAQYIRRKIEHWSKDGIATQKKQFNELALWLPRTAFGKESGLTAHISPAEFRKRVPIRDYEALRPWMDRMVSGESDVLWPGKPSYLAKTSGTTSGVKYIPITRESMPFHISSARDALLCYIQETGRASWLDGNLIFLSGSPVLEEKNGMLSGRLSGIVNHHVPSYLRRNQLPSWETNCVEDWEEKVDRIARETLNKPMSLISGIPPWVQMYFDRVLQLSGKDQLREVFPQFELLVYGGVNFEPYREKIYQTIGAQIPSIETYPASEGFIAFQDRQSEPGLLLLLNGGIYYEFVPVTEYFSAQPIRLGIEDVELGVNYAVIMNTNAGLWGYSIGDTVKFISKNPYKIVVTGRIKHFISAFGEHVIGEEVERAMQQVSAAFAARTVEFTVAPQVNPESGLPYHEWLVEFDVAPQQAEAFALALDEAMQKQNIYYRDLITGSILRPLKLSILPKGSFIAYMKRQGKLGGQNKVPRLSNDRKIADDILGHSGLH
ncbi:MAG: GH3 auxin-responsive promoter family protein [Bacteroidetes bacterium]|nr:GH3 auxin-responsive promoter family protein [Bacteroidota bacterium]